MAQLPKHDFPYHRDSSLESLRKHVENWRGTVEDCDEIETDPALTDADRVVWAWVRQAVIRRASVVIHGRVCVFRGLAIESDPYYWALLSWDLTPPERCQLPIYSVEGWTQEQSCIVNLVGKIYQNLMFMPPKQAQAWPTTSNDNPPFCGQPPLQIMLTGEDGLRKVLDFLLARVADLSQRGSDVTVIKAPS